MFPEFDHFQEEIVGTNSERTVKMRIAFNWLKFAKNVGLS
jgi:hypothetical protein